MGARKTHDATSIDGTYGIHAGILSVKFGYLTQH